MVRSAAAFLAAVLILVPALAAGQGTTAPPVVDSTAPMLSPPPAGEDAAPPQPAPPAGVSTDLPALVARAHPVVQAVMALLALSVAAVLTVFLFKTVEFALAFHRLRRSAAGLSQAADWPPLAGNCPLAAAVTAARSEAAGIPAPLTPDLRASARERLDLALDRIEAAAVQRLRSGTGLLASIGAVAPFVGLFGTVFGIMSSFLAIAQTGTTNLSVVAPGIAEALLATGIGLVAAIPAVLLYNRCMRRIGAFRHRLADGTAEIRHRFSRALDARLAGGN
ncbi:MAG: MotA/TolQ/ExbB proton channel family protein [Paracoccaceae bacterium]